MQERVMSTLQRVDKETCRMWDTTTDLALAAPPATVAILTIMGVTIHDAVSVVMLVWGLCLLAEKAWVFSRWIKRRGWQDWGA